MEGVIEQFGVDWMLVAAETVNFLIVLVILYFAVFKRVGSMLDKRNSVIAEGVENAQKAEEKLNEAEHQKHEILKQAGEQATAEIKAAVETAKQRETDIVDEANTKAERILTSAEEKGEEMKRKLIDSSREDIAKMIVLGAEQMLSKR